MKHVTKIFSLLLNSNKCALRSENIIKNKTKLNSSKLSEELSPTTSVICAKLYKELNKCHFLEFMTKSLYRIAINFCPETEPGVSWVSRVREMGQSGEGGAWRRSERTLRSEAGLLQPHSCALLSSVLIIRAPESPPSVGRSC